MKYNKIVLIGMMGSGKTAVAKALSISSGIELFEADEIFEKENNIKIKDFFQKYSEADFRIKESKILDDIVKKEKFILSTGGGVVLSEYNRNLIFQKNILSVYLKTSSNVIFERIKTDTSRPLLLVDDPKKEIEKLLLKRQQYYNMASVAIQTDNMSIDQIVEEIMAYEKN